MLPSRSIIVNKPGTSVEVQISVTATVSSNTSRVGTSSINAPESSTNAGAIKKTVAKANPSSVKTVKKVANKSGATGSAIVGSSSSVRPKAPVVASRFPVKAYGVAPVTKTNPPVNPPMKKIVKTTTTTRKPLTEVNAASPKNKYHTCPICLIDDPEEPMTTPCGHIFCKKCITKSLANSCFCPMCQKIVLRHQLIRVYLNH